MVFGRRVAFSCLLLSWLACSTEDTGLYSYDATHQQGVEEPPPPRDAGGSRTDRPPSMADARPDDKPDASLIDAPVSSLDVGPDLDPDRPAPTDQPLGVLCGKDGECHSGHCFDGVCCDSGCTDGCSACTQARTGRSDGTCAVAQDLEGKTCGKGCSTVATVPSLVEKVCKAGACVIPTGKPTVVESCHDSDPCVVAFCDDNEARCVRTGCGQGSCCCRSQNARMCLRQDQCHGGGRACE
jgi:hypothetical protein